MPAELVPFAERAGVLAFFAALAFILARALRASPWLAGLVVLAVAVLLAVPYNGGLSTIDRFFSVSGPTSAALFVLLGLAVLRSLPGLARHPSLDPVPVAAIVVPVGLIHYWLELAARTPFSPYAWGFAQPLAPIVLGVLPFLFLSRSLAIGAWLMLGGGLFLLGAYPSRNLFDYLIDPIALVVALILLIDAWIGRLASRPRGGAAAPPR